MSLNNPGKVFQSTDLTPQTIEVTSAAQLSGALRSDVVYLVQGMIDMGTTSIQVPEGGLFIHGESYFVSGLYTTADNTDLFVVDPSGSYSGNVRMKEIELSADGVNSKIFELDNSENFGSIEFISCNIGSFARNTTEIGTLDSYRQFRTTDCGFFRIQDGLTFTGTWLGGFSIVDTIVLSQANNSTLFKVGTGLTFGGRCISNINAASADPTTITFDFVASNFLLDGGFQLTGASFAPDSSISVTTDEDEIQAFFRDCVEIRNTRPGFDMEFTTQATTTISTVNTPVKAAGTTNTTRNTWWTQTGNNEVTYNSNLTKDFKITVNVTIDGGANDEIAVVVRKYDDSAAGYVDLKRRVKNISNVLGGLDVVNFSFVTVGEFSVDDRLEVWVENTDDTTDVTVLDGESEIFVEAI